MTENPDSPRHSADQARAARSAALEKLPWNDDTDAGAPAGAVRTDDLPLDEVPAAPWGRATGQVFLPTEGISTGDFQPLDGGIAGAQLGQQGTVKELVTCPECGAMAQISPARRDAEDFCPACDFPLFWARSTVVLPSSASTGASLRRLPGTVGRAATAFVPCPHCGEPNAPAAEFCIRCTRPMVLPPPPPPPPEPVYIAPLPPLPPEPERSTWWIWLIVGLLTLVVLGLTLWAVLGR